MSWNACVLGCVSVLLLVACGEDPRRPVDEGESDAEAEDAGASARDAGDASDVLDATRDTAPDVSDATGDAGADVGDADVDARADASAQDASTQDASAQDASARDASDDADTGGPVQAPDAGNGPRAWPTCEGPRFATRVAQEMFAPPRSGQDEYGRSRMPAVVLGPPMTMQNDVVTLGNGGSLTLGFDAVIVDGPGVDFIVFENPFAGWAELATVSVSEDGVTFYEFPCTAKQTRTDPPNTDYGQCAGWRSVTNPATQPDWSDAAWTDPARAGGDQYDLADLPGDIEAVRYVRITDRVDLVKTDDLSSPAADTFDLDAVSIVHARCP